MKNVNELVENELLEEVTEDCTQVMDQAGSQSVAAKVGAVVIITTAGFLTYKGAKLVWKKLIKPTFAKLKAKKHGSKNVQDVAESEEN